jgi:hypothetical protein
MLELFLWLFQACNYSFGVILGDHRHTSRPRWLKQELNTLLRGGEDFSFKPSSIILGLFGAPSRGRPIIWPNHSREVGTRDAQAQKTNLG